MSWELRGARGSLIGAALCTLIGCGGNAPANPPKQAALQGEKPAAGSPSKPGSSCDECRGYWCRAYEGVDLVAGCLDTPDLKLVPKPDPRFIADCKAAVQCAFEHECAYDAAKGPSHCYCGSRAVGECLEKGPATDAPCVKEWQAATRTTTNAEVLHRFDQITYPSGWAFHLLQCDRYRCGADSPKGRCVP